MRKARVIMVVLVAALLTPALAAAQDEGGLLLEEGTMQLGGMVGFDVTTYVIEGEDEHTSAILTLAPQFGYFVADHLELLARIGFAQELADESWYEQDSMLDFGLGIQYFVGNAGPHFYLGADIGMEFWEVTDDPYMWFRVTAPLGVLIPLNEHVAVDVGARFSALISLEDEDVAVLEVPMGFLGVQGFF